MRAPPLEAKRPDLRHRTCLLQGSDLCEISRELRDNPGESADQANLSVTTQNDPLLA